MKSLVVEDDFTSRILLQQILLPYGECHVAVNGREAVEVFGKALDAGQPYDLVCMDIMMPEKDGHTALREIRALEELKGVRSSDGAKVLMTTALGDVKNVAGAYNELCDGYLVKPLDKARLVSQLQQFCLLPVA
jgi:two-component system chemotaxis response regulator CheY